jgi:hypothetical protein
MDDLEVFGGGCDLVSGLVAGHWVGGSGSVKDRQAKKVFNSAAEMNVVQFAHDVLLKSLLKR